MKQNNKSKKKNTTKPAAPQSTNSNLVLNTPEVPQTPQAPKKVKAPMSPAKRAIICSLPVVLLVAVYVIGAMFYNNSFLANTYINDMNVGGMTIMEVENKLQADSEQSNIVIVRNDESTEEIKLTDIKYTCEYATDIQEIKDNQSKWGWLFALMGEEKYTVALKTSYDEEKLNAEIDSLRCITNEAIQDPVDAHIEKTESGFIVVDAIDGNRLDVDKVKATVKEYLEKGSYEIDLFKEECYLTAKIQADDPSITSIMEIVDKYNSLVITLDMTDATEIIDFSVFKDWITNDEGFVTADENGNVVINEELVEAWVTDDLRIKYNTFGSVRKFNATDLGEIEVGGSEFDTYGFQVKIADTTAKIIEALQNCENVTIEPVWNVPANCRGDLNDIGNTYIEVDLTRQHMWYYVNGELYVETDIKSGKPTPERETPTGVFRIWHKEKDRYLTGATWNAHVDFWLPFTWTGCGIHDAKWTNQFGGDYYKSSGSHGCLNTPYEEAQKIYEHVKYDTPVIVYKS